MTAANGHQNGASSPDPEASRPESPTNDDGRTRVVGRDFTSTRVLLDGKHFEDCTFETCTLIYRGGVPPNFVRCDFAAPQFAFEEAAKSTVQLMSAIYNGIDKRIIERTFDEIRKGFEGQT